MTSNRQKKKEIARPAKISSTFCNLMTSNLSFITPNIRRSRSLLSLSEFVLKRFAFLGAH